jgi:anti-sigma B factor antagonist
MQTGKLRLPRTARAGTQPAEECVAGEAAGEAVVVTLPEEIDLNNSGAVWDDLFALLNGPALVVADMSGTIFCDSTGMRMLVVARNRAEFSGATLRIVIRPGGALARSLAIVGFDRVLPIYHSIQDAMRAQPDGSHPAP